MMVAQVCNLLPGTFVHTFGDAHIYLNHLDAVNEQILRTPMERPTLVINTDNKELEKFKLDDFSLSNYNPMPSIKAPMAI